MTPVSGRSSPSGAWSASISASGVGRSTERSEMTIMVKKATGTVTIAGCASSAPATPPGSPRASPARIPEVARSAPATIPQAAAVAVSRVHQIPSRNSGQNVLAARAKAQPTSTAMSTP